jgi:acyl dehydratase
MTLLARSQLHAWVGKEVVRSDWLLITQERVNAFADVTGDHQYIHVDPQKAAASVFGGTIAHGFLTLSLLPWLGQDGGRLQLEGERLRLNYGLNKVRFPSPLRVGKRIRARTILLDFKEKQPGRLLLTHEVTMDIESEEKPALVAQTLAMVIFEN